MRPSCPALKAPFPAACSQSRMWGEARRRKRGDPSVKAKSEVLDGEWGALTAPTVPHGPLGQLPGADTGTERRAGTCPSH